MKFSLLFSFATLAASSIISHGATSNSFAGSNSYYLHGLHPDEQATYISSLRDAGAKVVRLWVTGVALNCTKSSSTIVLPTYEVIIGAYNYGTLDKIDSVLFQLHAAGIKAIISLHDANRLPPNGSSTGYNGIDIYGFTYNSSYNFYTNTTAIKQFDARVASILNYVSPRFHRRWADLSEAIMAFDLQNEPMIASKDLLRANDPTNWLCERSCKIRELIGNSGIKIATGGIGGSQYSGHEYNMLPKALNCSAIDIMSIHGYMNTAVQWENYFPILRDQAVAAGKHIMVEEFGVDTEPGNDPVATQVEVFNAAGVPWLYWLVILGKSVDQTCEAADGACCHAGLDTSLTSDFEISLTSSRANWTSLFHTADMTPSTQDWRGYID